MLKTIINTFANCFKIPELKSRILFTLLLLGLCRVIAILPAPGLDSSLLQAYFNSAQAKAGAGGLLGMFSMFTGGALEKCAIGTLGIMPYISATIIIQLLTAVLPRLSKLAREEGGRTKLIQYGRYLTVPLCLVQGFVVALGWENPGNLFPQWDSFLANFLQTHPGHNAQLVFSEQSILWYRIQTTFILTTGTLLMMWLGEQISERGIGNGVSLVISIGIVARLPQAFVGLTDMINLGLSGGELIFRGIAMILLLLGVVAGVIAVTQAQRKVAVQYAQRAVGRKVISGGTSFMPLRVNYAGVMPIIFAQAVLMFPQRIFQTLGRNPHLSFLNDVANLLTEGAWLYMLLYALMILFFSYFWVATQFNELQIADDLKKYGGYIPGVRPGSATSDYLHRAMSRITLAGAVFLTIIATIPIFMYRIPNPPVPYALASFFGGTSLLILVGVMLDTMRQMESHLLMRHYDGFLKKGKLKGRF